MCNFDTPRVTFAGGVSINFPAPPARRWLSHHQVSAEEIGNTHKGTLSSCELNKQQGTNTCVHNFVRKKFGSYRKNMYLCA